MKVTVAAFLFLSGVQAFTTPLQRVNLPLSTTARSLVPLDAFSDLPQHMSSILQDAFGSSSTFLADAMEVTADAATEVAKTDNGWFGFLTGPIMFLLQLIHAGLVAVGVSANAWGVSIIAITLLIKAVTFPLTKTQLESTNKMQAMQPAIKELQAKYQSNPEVMNQKIAEFYQSNDINPLAGCLPSLAQIPIFIGLYRAVLDLAQENKLNEPFLWLPNLEGPTYGADPTSGSDWLFKGWTDGVPSLGWDDTISFLILPVLLVVSQYLSMELMQPKTTDSAQQQSNAILKVLPLMIGWFSLNVPAALCVYWFVNNVITTGLSLFIRSTMPPPAAMEFNTGSSSSTSSTTSKASIFTPPREKPSGFGTPIENSSTGGIKTLTKQAIVDAEVVEKSNSDDNSEESIEATTEEPNNSSSSSKKRGKKKKN
ncbi:YidC/Oxa1 family membrane protein insertase [Fistulifera solaris]|uniref:YidC/Oxa1 family membrane protein insertase n=1 Tax=Fistulifera solaris TaxID=1519565 RepID=A0A1Z5JPG7_FISSO|nr:YidC/Oxa1 family membrane protein insertase [Fistulifera solaris]|eukprot:GAX15917.1 YidC/Oxa1 family membrane protein insertase [Fistulifera solaris]